MIERRDEELSRIYREAEGPRPPQRVDDNIIAASQRVSGAMPRPAGVRFARRWGTPLALAATVLVTGTLTLMVFERESGRDAVAPKAPRAGRPAKALPAESKRAEQPVTPPPEKLQPIAPAPPVPPDAIRRDQAQQRPSESATELRQQVRPAQAPAAAPAAGALSQSAVTRQDPSVAAASASRLAVSEDKNRTPEKWLEDIRKLKTDGRTTEVERELAEFRKRYPDYILPEDLR